MIALNARRATVLIAGVALVGACVVGMASGPGDISPKAQADPPLWREIAWPFPRDAWDPGRAFKCVSALWGGDIGVYIRPKLGFCNCATGVSDDEEVDRVSDLDLITPDFAPSGAGNVIETAGLRGRARHYDLRLSDGSSRTGLGMALSRNCDVVVAIAQSRSSRAIEQRAVIDLLASNPVRAWIEGRLDGRRQAVAF
jgi:hypothetical protein